MKRRDFVKQSTLAVLGGTGSLAVPGNNTIPGTLRYRRLGRTELQVSEISLGGSPVPSGAVFRLALERGVNYIDTSSSYMNGNSESRIGTFLKQFPGKLHVATKFHPERKSTGPREWRREIEGSMRRLGVNTIDILMVHGARSSEILQHEAVLELFRSLKESGRVRFSGVSCHRDPVGVLTPAITCGQYDVITVAYNAFSSRSQGSRQRHADYAGSAGITDLLNLAQRHDVGVVAMKSMAGGTHQDLSRYRENGVSLPQAKLKWVLENPAVGTVISEMLSFEILEENLSVSGAGLTEKERAALAAHRNRWERYTCRFCASCANACSRGMDLPEILRCRMYYLEHRKIARAHRRYRELIAAGRAGICSDCGKCDHTCPGGLPVRDLVRRTHELLASG